MQLGLKFALLVLMLHAGVASTCSDVLSQEPQRKLALLVGVSDYFNKRLSDLDYEKGNSRFHQGGSPIFAGSQLVFSQSYSGLFSLEPGQMAKTLIEKPAWFSSSRNFSTPIEIEDEILCFDIQGVMTVLNKATGKTIDKSRLHGFSTKRVDSIKSKSSFSSPVLVGNHIIAIFGMGDAFVISKEGESYTTKFVNQLGDDEETFLATPAVTQNELLIRSDKHLYCISKF